MNPKILYVSFDVVPAPKGAAIHILQIARVLAREFGTLQLFTVSTSNEFAAGNVFETATLEPGIEQTLIPAPGQNLIDRINNFRRFLESATRNQQFDIIHFRSPFEGLVFAKEKQKYCKTLIFEVNALPSIELKYRYPRVADDFELMEKLLQQERLCLSQSDLIITTSNLSKTFLAQKDESLTDKIRVIPNAVDLNLFTFKGINVRSEHIKLLYIGTLSAWQGVSTAIEATAILKAQGIACKLQIIAAARPQQISNINELIYKNGLNGQVEILPPRTQADLIPLMHDSDIILAPLSNNDRNIEQGCCPLKIIEGMAVGRPVLSTSLPVVQEIAGEPPLIHMCKPDSAGSLRDGIMQIINGGSSIQSMLQDARERVENNFSLASSQKAILGAYESVLSAQLSNSAS